MSTLYYNNMLDEILRSTTVNQTVHALCWKCKKFIYSGDTECPGLGHQKHHILLAKLLTFSPEKLQQLADETQMSEKERKIRILEEQLEKLRKS